MMNKKRVQRIKEIIHYQVNWFEKNSAEHMCANASIHKDNEHIVRYVTLECNPKNGKLIQWKPFVF